MEPALRDVVALGFGLAAVLAPLGGIIALLNRRDRREAALLARVAEAFPGEALRSDVAIRVRCGLLSPRAEVSVDLRVWSRDAVWEAMTRLRHRLPPLVRLRLDGTLERAVRTRLTVERVDAGEDLAAAEV